MNPSPDLDLGVVVTAGRLRVDRRLSRWPFVVGAVFANGPAAGSVVVQQTGGGLHDGDVRRVRVTAGPHASATVRGQGAVLVHPPADGAPTLGVAEELTLHAAEGSVLVHRGEPRILLPGSVLTSRTTVDVTAGGSVVVTESVSRHRSPGDARTSVELLVRAVDGTILAVDRTAMPTRGGDRVQTVVGTVHAVAPGRVLSVPAPEVPGAVAATSELPHEAGLAVRWCARDVGTGRSVEERAVVAVLRSLWSAA